MKTNASFKESGNRKSIMHLAFATDGTPSQILGICVVLRGLSQFMAETPSTTAIWIVAPDESKEKLQSVIQSAYGHCEVNTVTAELRPDDRYFVQIGLSKVFELIDPKQDVLCLDYDHLILRPITWSMFRALSNCITVSSEVRALEDVSEVLVKKFRGEFSRQRLNTSLIFGSAQLLRRIGGLWLESYEDIRSLVSRRHLTEYSFGLAASRAGVLVQQCSASVQSNFAVPFLSASTFHYGGDSLRSEQLRRLLHERASAVVGNQILEAVLDRTETDLINTLADFSLVLTDSKHFQTRSRHHLQLSTRCPALPK
jgi:hypothetical protein